MFRLTVIIPVHNRKAYTRKCLNSLRKQTYKKFTIVVIDDGSTDGTSEMIRKEYPEVDILDGNGNLWWSASINMGINHAKENNSDIILTLNDDTEPDEYFIEEMVNSYNSNPNAVFGALEIDANSNEVIYAGESINWVTAGSTLYHLNSNPSELKGLKSVTHLPGRGLLIPIKIIRAVGMFNEKDFPQYAADSDFTHRVKRIGFELYCNYQAKLYTYPDESGSLALRDKKSLKKYYQHLFSIKGGGNLKIFMLYAFENCPKRYLLFFLISGFSRRLLGYLIEWIKD